MLLENKVAIITGAASARGIGRATAALFAKHGARVAILDVNGEGAQEAAASLGPRHIGHPVDVTSKASCASAIGKVLATFGRVDILFNCAGITQPLRLLDVEPANWDAVLDVNMRGTLYMSQATVPSMREQKSGSIVNMSSVSAQRGGGIFGGPHYSAAKAGILGLTKAMARELAPDNVRVNAICPSLIDTDITAGMMTPERRQMINAQIPMGRPGRADEVAGCALFLASDLSSYVTGSEIDVNGGSHIH